MENIASRITLFHNLYFVCLVGAILCLLISIVLFMKLDIRNVIGFFTGNQAKREIQRIQQNTFEQKPNIRNADPISQKSRDVPIRKVEEIPTITVTEKLQNGAEEQTAILKVYEPVEEQTTVLQKENIDFFIEREIIFIHTNEIIE